MGGIDSSSKRKASKKKSNKTSSQRKKSSRKQSKKHNRDYDSVSSYSDDVLSDSVPTSSSPSESHYKKIKKNKSKKLRRRDHSVSSKFDAHSTGSESDSLSNSKNKKKKKKKRSRSDLKSRKRKTRDRSASPERKRKRARRDRVDKTRKKLKKSKKYSINSSSYNSMSCSTCQSGGSGNEDNGRRSKIKEKETREGRELHKGNKKRKYRSPSCTSCSRESYEFHEARSPSCSSCSRGSEQNLGVEHSEGALVPVNNPRRLRSVIAIAYQPLSDRENRWEANPNKEEIVYNRDDYQSPDKNERRSQRELDGYSHDTSDKRIRVQNFEHEEVTEGGGNYAVDDSDQKIVGDNPLDGVRGNSFEHGKEADVSAPVPIPDGDDLESILQQKALENLRKFQGGHKTGSKNSTNSKMSDESDVGESYSRNAYIIQNKSPLHDRSYDQETSGPMLDSDLSQSTGERIDPYGENILQESESTKQAVIHSSDRGMRSGHSEEWKSARDHFESTNSVDPCPDQGATTACSSSVTEPILNERPVSGEHSIEERQNEAKDDGFEKKTMSVMRVGEMVEVSYKVYIPKRAPALSQRPLRW